MQPTMGRMGSRLGPAEGGLLKTRFPVIVVHAASMPPSHVDG